MLECREQKREKMGVSKERNGYWKGKGKGNLFFWAAKFDRLWSKLTFDQKRSKLLFSTKHGRTYQATGNGRNYIIDRKRSKLYFRPDTVECLFSTRIPLKNSKTKVRENSRHMDIFDRQLFSTKFMGGKKLKGYFRHNNFDRP